MNILQQVVLTAERFSEYLLDNQIIALLCIAVLALKFYLICYLYCIAQATKTYSKPLRKNSLFHESRIGREQSVIPFNGSQKKD